MTSLALTNGDDYPAAAGKHLDDASALVAADRPDGAGYLVGYVVECSLRTVVMVGEIATRANIPQSRLKPELAPGSRTLSRLLSVASKEAREQSHGHDLESLAKATTTYARVLNTANAQYAPPMDTTRPLFKEWTESLRYRAEGKISKEKAEAWLKEADEVYKSTIGKMRRDGVVTG